MTCPVCNGRTFTTKRETKPQIGVIENGYGCETCNGTGAVEGTEEK